MQDDEMSDVSHDDDSVLSDTMSICSEIRAHRYENGRRYNAFRAGEYWFVASRLVAAAADMRQGPQRRGDERAFGHRVSCAFMSCC
jgi:hypothetical protein